MFFFGNDVFLLDEMHLQQQVQFDGQTIIGCIEDRVSSRRMQRACRSVILGGHFLGAQKSRDAPIDLIQNE